MEINWKITSLLLAYTIIIAFTFSIRTLDADEGTHMLLGLFYKDLTNYVIHHGFAHLYTYAVNYLVYYPKITVYYPPLYHLILSGVFNFIISEYAAKIITLCFSLVGIFFTYKVGKLIFNEQIGLITTIIFALSPTTVYLSGSVMMDVPLYSFFMASFWLYVKAFTSNSRKYFVLAGIVFGLGLLTKWTIIPLVFIFIGYLATEREKIKKEMLLNFFLSLVIAFIVVMPYVLFIYKMDLLKLIIGGPVTAGLREKDPQFTELAGWLWYPKELIKQLTPQITLLGIVALVIYLFKKDKNWKLLIVWFLSYYLIFTFIPNKDGRFVLAYLPVIIMPLVYYIEKVKKYGKLIIIILVVSQTLYTFYYLPRGIYPVKALAEKIYENPKNVAMISEGGSTIHSSALMFEIAKLDEEKTIQVFRPCVFYNLNENEVQQFLKENNVYYLVLVEGGDGIENFSKFRNITLVNEFYYAKLYTYNQYSDLSKKKCNYVCLTEEKICYKEI
jgi:4-amino-4-deoxy-L-arabinose transferase-like glycosyltransferase